MKHTRAEAEQYYTQRLKEAEENDCVKEVMGYLGKNDLYYLLVYILGRKDIRHDWLYERCKEVQEDPNFNLDLWSRGHYKSTIITFALTIQDIINDPEITMCIFSITRPIAKAFLDQIKKELEDNEILKWLYNDVLYQEPRKESKSWSIDKGITVKRKSNPKECTLEAHGFIEGLPTSRHYHIRIYDDAIDQDHVTNIDIIKKANRAWELSLSLYSPRIIPKYEIASIERYIGTRYSYNDVYKTIEEKGGVTVRIRTCTDNGKPDGKSVFLEEKLLRKLLSSMGTYTAACQMFLDPKQDAVNGFDINDLREYIPDDAAVRRMNRYIVVDPASKKKAKSDYTTMWVIGLAQDNNYYVIDGVHDRLGLHERAEALINLHQKWNPIGVGYEEYGMQADIEHIKYVQKQITYNFEITPLGGNHLKEGPQRIGLLIPVVEQHRYFVPVKLVYVNLDGKAKNLTDIHRTEFNDFPFGVNDDTIDCAARIKDPKLKAKFPMPEKRSPRLGKKRRQASGMDYNPLDT